MTLLQMSFSGAVLILAIIVIRAAAVNRLPKKTFLFLWWIALLRLLLPFSVPSIFSAYSFANQSTLVRDAIGQNTAANVIPAAYEGEISINGILVETTAAQGNNSGNIWLTLWSVGIALCAAFFMVSYLRGYFEFRASLPVSSEFAAKWLKEHRLRRPVTIRQSDRIAAPLTYGVFHPVILMPENTDWRKEEQLRYILAHEYVHIRRFDAVTKMFLAAALCFHWFNPLAWVMYFLCNRDMELACDESVVRQFGQDSRSDYANTLISMMEQKNDLSPLCNHFSRNAVEERITAIMRTKRLTIGAVAVSIALLAVVAVLFATSAQNRQMVFAAGRLFVSAGKDVSEQVALEAEGAEYDSPYIGVIESAVSSSQIPDQELQSNFGHTGSEVIFHGSGVAVNMDGAWIQFEPVSDAVPDSAFAEEESWVMDGAGADGMEVPDIVLEAAVDFAGQKYLDRQKEGYSNWRIESLAYVYTYEDLDGMKLQVYQLNYEFLAEEPEKVTSVGGMTVDAEVWVVPEYPDSNFLIFRQEGEELSYLTSLFENDCFPGDEVFTSDLRQRLAGE